MKWNLTLTWITTGYILVNILFAWHASTMKGGTSLVYVFIFPAFWIITLIIVGIWTYIQRKTWFQKDLKLSTFLLLLLCTPLPLWAFSVLTRPEIRRSGSGYWPKNGVTIMTESWVYNNGGQKAVEKFWLLDSENWLDADEKEFKKDSVWVYFDKNGDTLKTETYKNDKLIKTKEYKK